MELILMILFIVLAAVSSNNKKKKAQANARPRVNRPGVGGQAPRSGTAPVRDLEDALDLLSRKLETAQSGKATEAQPVRPASAAPARATKSPAPQGEPMLLDEECHGGSMAHTHAEGHSHLADEDCYGGSMAHTHTEGVSRADHARRMAAIDASGEASDVLPETIDARALRRAVVMAEVLGKPRALRRN